MGFYNSLRISATGLTAEKMRMDLITNNIANVNTTKTSAGTPYRKKMPVFQELESNQFDKFLTLATGKASIGGGVEVVKVVEDQSDFKRIFDPSHPDADSKGFVLMPNFDSVTEMVDLISASRAYDANVTAINSTKAMLMKALDIGR